MKQQTRRTISITAALFTLGLASPATPPAHAAPKAATKAETIAAQAKTAYDAAQYDRALDLYLAAHRADPKQVALLYAAARAAHLAGKLDRAEELYQQALADSGLNPEVAAKAREHLLSIATRRAESRAEEAEALQKAGKYKDAAEAWRSAALLAPARVTYVCRAARASKLAGETLDAERDYKVCRDKAPAGSADRAEAERALLELEKAPRPAVVGGGPTPAPLVDKKPDIAPPKDATKDTDPQLPSGVAATTRQSAWNDRPLSIWATIGGGALGLAAGAAVVAWAWNDEQDLNAKIDARTNGKVGGISYADAKVEHDSINLRYGLGWAAAGLGAAALGTGTWLYIKGAPPPATVLPMGAGAVVSVQF